MAGRAETLILAPIPWIEAADWFARIRDRHADGLAEMVNEGRAMVLGIFDETDLRGAVALSVDDARLEVNALAGDGLGHGLVLLARAFRELARVAELKGVRFYTTRRGLVRIFATVEGVRIKCLGRGRWRADYGV